MRNNDQLLAGFLILVFSFCAGYCAGIQTHAAAQDRPHELTMLAPTPIVLTRELTLARVCASEAGLQTDTNDCAAIHQVLVRGARQRHMDYIEYAMAYAGSAFDGSGNRPWLMELDEAGTEPRRWPRMRTRRVRTAQGMRIVAGPGPSWRRYRRRWLDLLAHARQIVRGHIRVSCEPEHWGCPQDRLRQCRDHERAVRAGWQLVDCGETKNEFWAVPEAE